jgi:ribonuclease-3
MYDVLGFIPGNISIYKLAFSHKSSQNEKSLLSQNNERLEYLGDAVLGTIVAEYLFKKYPDSNEGFLTKMRSKIVKRKTLNRIGDKMELDGVLQEFNNTRLSRSMLGNAVEALVGAIYLDAGYSFTHKYIVEKILRRYLDIHELENYDDNYKSQLLEWCQKHGKTISYKLISRYKYEKRDRFKVGVFVNNQRIATADDFNKKSAEQSASEKAMIELGILSEEEDDD